MQPKDSEWGNGDKKKGEKRNINAWTFWSGGIILIDSNSIKNISIKMASE